MMFQTEILNRLKKLKDSIGYCKTRKQAEEIQKEIQTLEDQLEACPLCGNYEIDYDDDLTCEGEFHKTK